MDYFFAAHHEAGHALVAQLLGAEIASLGLEPTPHCVPDIRGLGPWDAAVICMAGAAATMVYFGTMGPCETDILAAKHYAKNHMDAFEQACHMIKEHPDAFMAIVHELIDEIGEERKFEKAKICVDTVEMVRQYGGVVDDLTAVRQ